MRGLTSAGFNIITLAGNHRWNTGVPGIEETIAWLRNNGIAYVGAGMNINEARRPAVIERKGTKSES
jgi:poly-gamma-glutamate capsule biosynthesis protein CapA/YwtB (metallophosphatase superfamily)